jgi:glyoxylase-like metal-dependent hydrolase (beta-lactamase superfamily II)
MVLLTHIHIDHAGGIGSLATHFPHAAVVCHPKGVGHLADPERLWQGSLKTLGKIAEAYGPISPVALNRLLGSDQLDHPEITVFETPGHAAHHCSYMAGDILFAGEACGVSLPFDDGVYLRPATPPRFFLETSLGSLDKLLLLNPRHLCYGHVGGRSNAVEMMAAHRTQLIRWKEMILPFFNKPWTDPSAGIRACADYLVDNDPLLDGLAQLPPDARQRERGFLHNSLLGYWGYLESAL